MALPSDGVINDKPTRVVIADHHPPTRLGIKVALEEHGFEVCAEVPDAASAVQMAIEMQPHLCLIEVQIPGSGIAAARELAARVPKTAVVMLATSENRTHFLDSLRSGAAGYLIKDIALDRLPISLERVLAGEAVIPRSLVSDLVHEFQGQEGNREIVSMKHSRARLTTREWEVLHLLQQNLSTAQISDRLFISRATVRSHIAATLNKLGVNDRQSAIELLQNG